jgi:hypothetical protein
MTKKINRSFDGNPYYDPEKCGFKLALIFDDNTLSYEYDTTIFLEEIETGKIYAAHNAGCSCPTPFEDYHKLSDLTACPNVKAAIEFFNENNPGQDITESHRKIRELYRKDK